MKSGAGKTKGSAFERLVCKRLSLWISKGEQEDVFWRSAASGGRSTVAYAKGKRLAAQAGDISCIHSVGAKFAEEFQVECKTYRDLNFAGLLTGTGHLIKFWRETQDNAKKYGKRPMLIAKQNQYPAIVCLGREDAEFLMDHPAYSITAPIFSLYAVTFDYLLSEEWKHG